MSKAKKQLLPSLVRTSRKKGFTVAELVLLAAVLAVLLAVFIPVYIRAKERATQKYTMADMHMWGEAITSYISDNSIAPTNPRDVLTYKKPIIKELSPYLKAIRIVDWWGHPFRIWTRKGVKQYGIITNSEKDFIIASFGRMGLQEGWRYDPENPEAGFFEIKDFEDFDSDLVMFNNRFIRSPRPKKKKSN